MSFNLLEWSSLASKLSETLVALVDKTQAAVKARRNFQDGLRELFDLYGGGWYGEVELHPESSVWLALVPHGADEKQAEKNLEVEIKEILEVPTVQQFIEQRVFYETLDAAITVGNYEAAQMILTECDEEVYMSGMHRIVQSHLPQYVALLEDLNEHNYHWFIEEHGLYEIDDWAEFFKELHERQEIPKRRWRLLRDFVIKRWVCFYWMELTAQTTRERDLATACFEWQQL